MSDLNHNLFIIDYNNGYEKTIYWFRISEDSFGKDWTMICNSIPTTRITGLTCFHVQDYMQDNGIKFNMYPIKLTYRKALDYINANKFNETHSKLVEHSNMGNY